MVAVRGPKLDIQDIERCAYEAWPAAEVHDLEGWRLRATGGVTRRANSVWPGECRGDLPLADRIEQVEHWYRSRGLPPTFQVQALARPPALDRELEARGYRVDAPVSVQAASAMRVAAPTTRVTARVERAPGAAWLEISVHRGRFAATADTYRGLLARIGGRARYALAEVDGHAAAVGLGVVGDGRMGIFSMLTVPEARRRGAGRAVLSALAAAALEAGVHELYLQVERANPHAQALYGSASFAEVYGYHYRVAD